MSNMIEESDVSTTSPPVIDANASTPVVTKLSYTSVYVSSILFIIMSIVLWYPIVMLVKHYYG